MRNKMKFVGQSVRNLEPKQDIQTHRQTDTTEHITKTHSRVAKSPTLVTTLKQGSA